MNTAVPPSCGMGGGVNRIDTTARRPRNEHRQLVEAVLRPLQMALWAGGVMRQHCEMYIAHEHTSHQLLQVWSETPIRDARCCFHPLTGVPCLRPGPRTAAATWAVRRRQVTAAAQAAQTCAQAPGRNRDGDDRVLQRPGGQGLPQCQRSAPPPGPHTDSPAPVFCVSWAADLEFRGTRRRPDWRRAAAGLSFRVRQACAPADACRAADEQRLRPQPDRALGGRVAGGHAGRRTQTARGLLHQNDEARGREGAPPPGDHCAVRGAVPIALPHTRREKTTLRRRPSGWTGSAGSRLVFRNPPARPPARPQRANGSAVAHFSGPAPTSQPAGCHSRGSRFCLAGSGPPVALSCNRLVCTRVGLAEDRQ